MGRSVVVIGTQWGDEGKGKIVDWLTDEVAAVVRFKAGTTLAFGYRRPEDRSPCNPIRYFA